MNEIGWNTAEMTVTGETKSSEREREREKKKELSPFRFVHYKRHVDWLAIEPGSLRPATNHVSGGTSLNASSIYASFNAL
jgi:hypothetical protein